MDQETKKLQINGEQDLPNKPMGEKKYIRTVKVIIPVVVVTLILLVLAIYTYSQRKSVISNVEYVTNSMADNVASNIANEIGYAKSSIKLTAISIAQTMNSDIIENPSEVILPMLGTTPFGGIEYIRPDGMNVMNIGEPFDASDRVYYKEGIAGITGVWNNYHPKTSKETLMNFYTPLMYEGNIAGVITGYIEATTQISPLLDVRIYGKPIYGVLLDENNMIICSNVKADYVPDLSLGMFLGQFNASIEQTQSVCEIIASSTEKAISYKLLDSNGRICIATIPNTNWKVAFFVSSDAFEEIISEHTRDSVLAIVAISSIVIVYSTFLILKDLKRRKAITVENAKLEEENRVFNETNQKAFAEISEIRDIISSANMGTWRIELLDGQEPRMIADGMMKELLGISGKDYTPEQVYAGWYNRITAEAIDSVVRSVDRMKRGHFDENTYLWNHPTKGVRYVRCGGTAIEIPNGCILRGYHYDVDDVVREDQAKVVMLRDALNEKNEYYSTLGTLGDVFYSMHVINLTDDTVVEFNAKNVVREIVNRSTNAAEMMVKVMTATTTESYREAALEFTDLHTLAERMKGKKLISFQFVGNNAGWVLASFITMDADDEGRPTKVIYTTRVIDDEKKQEERLIKKAQTDELTGLLNRRAYEEDIYEHNDLPDEEKFVYISMDVNGLKVVNDTLGHTAGDELLIGACQCMKKSLGSFGKLYRTGGDEFVAIIFCDAQETKEILKDFDETIAGWSGKIVDSLTISYGWIDKYERPELSVRQLGAIAEQRMYDAKSEHYRKTGVDRRGQKDAHKALCELYTKILKINITDDSYQIINMDATEQTAEKGFADKISEWLKSFGTTGQVHPDDLAEYLELTSLSYMQDYFKSDKTSLHIFYRRKFEGGFKRVMMELIPANDYTAENQNLFLYVKNIDK